MPGARSGAAAAPAPELALPAEPLTAAEVAARFEGARADLVRRHLETLALMGEVRSETGGRYLAAGVTVCRERTAFAGAIA